MEVEALMVILLFSLIATALLFAYIFASLSKSFRDLAEESREFVRLILELYEHEKEKTKE